MTKSGWRGHAFSCLLLFALTASVAGAQVRNLSVRSVAHNHIEVGWDLLCQPSPEKYCIHWWQQDGGGERIEIRVPGGSCRRPSPPLYGVNGIVARLSTAVYPETTYNVSVATDWGAGCMDAREVTATTLPVPPTLSLSLPSNPVCEGEDLVVVATLSWTLAHAVTIPLSLRFNSRTTSFDALPEDVFGAAISDIVIPAGATSGTSRIGIVPDGRTESTESFTVALDTLPSTVLAGTSSVRAYIRDRGCGVASPASAVSLSASTNPVDEGASVTVTARLSAALAGDATIPLTVTAGTAEAGDYGTLSGITIPGGAVSGTGTVATADDADTDDETFTVALGSLPSTVSAGSPSSVTVTIRDDDGGDPPSPPGGGGGDPPSPPLDEASSPQDDDDSPGDDGDGDGDDDGAPDYDSPPVASFTVSADCADFGARSGEVCHARTGDPITFEDTSTGGTAASRTWDFGYDTRTKWTAAAEDHAWPEPGFYDVTLTVGNGAGESSRSRTFLVQAADPAGDCVPDDTTICLLDLRYSVRSSWWTADGRTGVGSVVQAGTNQSGLFWFFEPDNWEVLIKVLDGTGLNDHVWVYGASATDLGFELTVRDTVTGVVKSYTKEPGSPAPAIIDVGAFPDSVAP